MSPAGLTHFNIFCLMNFDHMYVLCIMKQDVLFVNASLTNSFKEFPKELNYRTD